MQSPMDNAHASTLPLASDGQAPIHPEPQAQPDQAGQDHNKAEALFKACDLNADGLVDADELTEALLSAARDAHVHLTEDQARHAAYSIARAAARASPMSRCSSSLMSSSSAFGGGDTPAPVPRPLTQEALRRLAMQCLGPEELPGSCCTEHTGCCGAAEGQNGVECASGDVRVHVPTEGPAGVPTSGQEQMQEQGSGAQRRGVGVGGAVRAVGAACGRWAADAVWFARSTRGAFTIVLCAALASMFAWGFVVHLTGFEFAVMGYAWPGARACAYVIRLSMALMLFFVCARSLTFLRATPLRYLIPVDHAISVHMLLGYVFFIAAMGHALCHFVGHTLEHMSASKYAAAGLPPPTMLTVWANWPSVSGLLMLTILITFYAWAVPSIRRSPLLRGTSVGRVLGNYNTFHRTHQMLWVSLVLLALLHPLPGKPGVPHTSRLWLFIAVPFVMLLVERAYRAWVRGQRVELVSIKALPGVLPGTPATTGMTNGQPCSSTGVTQLVLRVTDAPYSFRHKPGQYLHLQCEEVSRKQWHPFTITSAPDDELLTIHAAVQGDWTDKLYALATSVDPTAPSTSITTTTARQLPGSCTTMTTRSPTSIIPGESPSTHRDHHHLDMPSPYSTSASNVQLSPSPNTSGPLSMQLVRQALEEERRSSTSTGSSGSSSSSEGTLAAAKKLQQHARASPRSFLSMRSGLPCQGVVKPHFRVDGPYGAPTQHFMEHEVLVLVAGGIGVTPMVAILRHIMHQLAARQCAKCNMVHLDADFWLRRLYLHFIFRQQGMLQWFRPTFEGVTRLAPASLCSMHFHYTGAAPGAADNTLLQVAQRVESQAGRCLLADAHIRAKTSFGRPDLRQIVASVAAAHPASRVGVLFCGASEMGDQLERAVRESGHPSMKIIREVFGN